MGLIRFAIYFILGNIFLTAVEKHSHRVKDIYLSWTIIWKQTRTIFKTEYMLSYL